MRITVKVSGAGNNGLTRIPWIGVESIDKELCDDNGNLDEAKVRAMFRNFDGVTMSSDDTIRELAVATELLKQVRNACRYIISNRRAGDMTAPHDRADCADDRHAERNLSKGRFVYVRTDIWYSRERHVMNVRIGVQNPKNVVGVAERIALDYALISARVMNHIADDLGHGYNKMRFNLVGGAGCPGIFDEARDVEETLKRRAEVRDANAAMWKCERRTASGYCSPCRFDCPHYRGGRCVELPDHP